MTTANSTNSTPTGKPAKPYADFPLFPHASGQWAKKIRGKVYYVGVWDNPDAALAKYLDQKDSLHASRKPKVDTDEVTVKQLCNEFLNFKKELCEGGELAALTFYDYETACKEIVGAFGKSRLVADLGPADFAELRNNMAGKWGHQRLGKTIQLVRSVFKYGYDSELLDRPIRFGPGFKRPSKKTIRIDRARQGVKLFTAEEIHRMIGAASPALKAMILLGGQLRFWKCGLWTTSLIGTGHGARLGGLPAHENRHSPQGKTLAGNRASHPRIPGP